MVTMVCVTDLSAEPHEPTKGRCASAGDHPSTSAPPSQAHHLPLRGAVGLPGDEESIQACRRIGEHVDLDRRDSIALILHPSLHFPMDREHIGNELICRGCSHGPRLRQVRSGDKIDERGTAFPEKLPIRGIDEKRSMGRLMRGAAREEISGVEQVRSHLSFSYDGFRTDLPPRVL